MEISSATLSWTNGFCVRSKSDYGGCSGATPMKAEGDVPVQNEALLKPLFLSETGLEEVKAAPILSLLRLGELVSPNFSAANCRCATKSGGGITLRWLEFR